MHYYRATLEYDGTGYCGFQWQQDMATIQNELNQSIKSIVEGKFSTMGASRTDSGVHALKQVVKISAENAIDGRLMPTLLNTYLPPQVRCRDFSLCPGTFKPAHDSEAKVYHYYFSNERYLPSEQLRFVANISNPLEHEAMKVCVEKIRGTHDFKNFCSLGSNVKTTVREIFSCELSMGSPRDLFDGTEVFSMNEGPHSIYCLRIVGNGFLKQMIRHLVSALWMVGSGKLSTDDFTALLAGGHREKRLWKVAPANGLFLVDIHYPQRSFMAPD